MAANVTYIPPKAAKPEALRVAAYCRVSSDSSDQLHSYATQIKAYTEQIGAHADWELVDVYADEGLTGTRMDKRTSSACWPTAARERSIVCCANPSPASLGTPRTVSQPCGNYPPWA